MIVATAVGTAISQTSPAAAPSERPASVDAPVPIILDAPGSLDALWERIRSPDFVLLRGDRYRELLRSRPGDAKDDAIVEAVAVRGVIEGRVAELDVEIRAAATAAGSTWVPIRLDGLVLSSASEGGKILPIRNGAGGGWEAQVSGAGHHVIRIGLITRVTAGGYDRRLELPIPLAGSTTLGMVLRDDPSEVTLGAGETIIPVKTPEGAGVRVSAELRPRSKLDMRWRVAAQQGADEPPLLGVQGDVSIDVTPDAVQSRTRWSIASLRGVTSAISVEVDPDEELLDVELDGRAVAFDASAPGKRHELRIPLPEPFRPTSPAHAVTLVSRRKVAKGAEATLPIRGSTISNSSFQGGAIAVSQHGPIWVDGSPVRNLQRTDPANDLPSALRSRPGTVLAYRIVGKPFELNLRIQPSPALIEVGTDALIVLRPAVVSAEFRLAFRTTPGHVFEIDLPLQNDREFETPATDDVVASSRWKTPEGTMPGKPGEARVLSVQLTSKARDSGAFALTLRARRPLPPNGGRVDIRWPLPSQSTSLGGQVAVIRAPGVEAKVWPSDGVTPAFSTAEPQEEADWPWSLDRYRHLDDAPLWLSYEGSPHALSLDVSLQATSYRSETGIVAEVGRAGVTYHSSHRLDVIGGLIDEFELVVPADVGPDWSIEGLEIANRYLVDGGPTRPSRYRVSLSRKGVRSIAFQLRYMTAFEAPLSTSPRPGRFSWIRPLPDAPGPCRLMCHGSPGVKIEIDSAGWEGRPLGDNSSSGLNLVRDDRPAQLPEFRASAEPLVPLPRLIVSRAYLRTIQGTDEVRTTAHFRLESHGPSATVAVPQGSRLIEARLDGERLIELDRSDPDQYLVPLDPNPTKRPRLLTVSWAHAGAGARPVAARSSDRRRVPGELLGRRHAAQSNAPGNAARLVR